MNSKGSKAGIPISCDRTLCVRGGYRVQSQTVPGSIRILPLLYITLISLFTFSGFAEDKITYEEHIRPVLDEHCFSCHNPDKTKADLDLTTYANLMKGGSGGEVVEPGDPDNSIIYLVSTHEEEPVMPPKGDKMSDPQLALFKKWIAGGAVRNDKSKPTLTKKSNLADLPIVTSFKPQGALPIPGDNFPAKPVRLTEIAGAVPSMVTNPWSPVVALAGQEQVVIYQTDTGDLLGILPFKNGNPYSLKFSANGSVLIAGGGLAGKSGYVVGWDVATGEKVIEVGAEYDAVHACDIRPDHAQVALGGPGKKVRIHDAKTGTVIHTITAHSEWVTAISYSPDGKWLATGDRNGGLQIWEAANAGEAYSLHGHKAGVTDISWSANAQVIASSDFNGNVYLWNVTSGQKIKNWEAHPQGISSVRFLPNHDLVTGGADKAIKLWDSNGKAKATKLAALPDTILQVAAANDGIKVLAADWQGSVVVFDSQSGKEIRHLSPNPTPENLRRAKAD
jgi:WD40 repeat protein